MDITAAEMEDNQTYYANHTMKCECWLVLATGPGNPQEVRSLAGGSVWFALLPGQKPEPLCLGGFLTWTEPKTL